MHKQHNHQSGSPASDFDHSNNDNSKSMKCMFITANVGSLFYLDQDNLSDDWIEQFRLTIARYMPQFIGLHCQEVGGKNYDCQQTTKFVHIFLEKILQLSELANYARVRIFLDQDFRIEKFTALGSFYFVHDSIETVEIWNFQQVKFVSISDRRTFSGTLDKADCVENVKFPKEFHPDAIMSRKGFMRTRWRFQSSQILELVNIHLFHDSSNFPALTETPSRYAKIRQRALEYALNEISKPIELRRDPTVGASNPLTTQNSSGFEDNNRTDVPMFIFGDFNFRLTTNGVIEHLTNGQTMENIGLKTDVEGDYYKFPQCHNYNSSSSSITDDAWCDKKEINKDKDADDVTVRHKFFGSDKGDGLETIFLASDNRKWLLEYDNEPEYFKPTLHEFEITFFPSYPFQEGKCGDCNFAMTRCPSWCDRILFNKCAQELIITSSKLDKSSTSCSDEPKHHIDGEDGDDGVIYQLMGSNVPMGDHKPVLLSCRIMIK